MRLKFFDKHNDQLFEKNDDNDNLFLNQTYKLTNTNYDEIILKCKSQRQFYLPLKNTLERNKLIRLKLTVID